MSSQKLEDSAPEGAFLPKQPEVNIGTAGHVDHGKCLDLDEYVLIGGRLRTGRELLESLEGRIRIMKTTGGSAVYDIVDNAVLSLDRDLRFVQAPARLYIQRYEGKIFDVVTGSGRKISISPEHPLLANRKGAFVWIKGKELGEDDHVAFAAHIPLGENLEFRSPLNLLKRSYDVVTYEDYVSLATSTDGFRSLAALGWPELDKVRVLQGLSYRQLARLVHMDEVDLKKKVLQKARAKENALARVRSALSGRPHCELSPSEFIAGTRKGRWSARCLRIPTMNEDLAKWFAFVWAEGTSDEGRIAVSQSVQMDMLREFLRISEKEFGVEFRKVTEDDYHFNSRPFVDLLRFRFDFVPGSEAISEIAGWTLGLPQDLKAAFLRWFFTLNGGFNERSGQIMISQKNEKNVVTIGYLLQSLGITPRFSQTRVKLQKIVQRYARLMVSGRENLRLFERLIGFQDPRIQERLTKYLASIRQASKESDLMIPIDPIQLEDLLRSSGILRDNYGAFDGKRSKDANWYGAYQTARKTGTISRSKLVSIIESVDENLLSMESLRPQMKPVGTEVLQFISQARISQTQLAFELGTTRKKLINMFRQCDKQTIVAAMHAARRLTVLQATRARSTRDQFCRLLTSNLHFDKIRSIRTREYSGLIFDLTVPGYSNFLAGKGGIVSHNSTLIQAITGVWTSAHSEELKRGITIKVGYADAAFYECPVTPPPAAFSTSSKCPVCGRETKLLRAVSFVDSPGHESLMTNMLAGAFLMDGALFVIAANEQVPKPQTREHLQALQMLGMKNIVIAQNKIDLVTDQEAKKNHDQIKKFVADTVAADAPIVPISAQQKLNIDALIEAVEEIIPTPKRDPKADPMMYVVRSFDVNRPGAEIGRLSGGVLGGSLTRGELRVGEEIELRPGMVEERSGRFAPIVTKISALQTGAGHAEKVGPGGLVAVGTRLDPTFTKGDQMVGSVIGKPGTLPETLEHVTLEVELLESAVGLAEAVKVDKVKLGESLRLNLGTASTLASVTSARGDTVEADLKKPVAVELGMRAALSRRIAERWRLIGSGVLK